MPQQCAAVSRIFVWMLEILVDINMCTHASVPHTRTHMYIQAYVHAKTTRAALQALGSSTLSGTSLSWARPWNCILQWVAVVVVPVLSLSLSLSLPPSLPPHCHALNPTWRIMRLSKAVSTSVGIISDYRIVIVVIS